MSCCVGEISGMEISLPLSVLPLYPASRSVQDDGDYDVPPSPTQDVPSPHASGVFFQRGFSDCAQEALKFLVEKEGMHEDSSVVVGLKAHLAWSSHQFTPASLASPSPPSPSCPTPIFSFPQPPVLPPHVTKSKSSVSGSCACVVSSGTEPSGVRYAPYTVASYQHRRHHPAANRLTAVTCPATRGLERVLKDNIISSDDLQGVLRCLHYSNSESPKFDSSAQLVNNLTAAVGSAYATTIDSRLDRSLNDSGLSEAGSADLTDEVDGVEEEDDGENDVFDFALNNFHFNTSHPVQDTDVIGAELSLRQNDSDCTPPGENETGDTFMGVSSPSSQLSLLSSLSSGTHRLTMTSDNVTSSRIQSLANEILLLLEEEAEDGEDDDEEEESDDEDDEEDDIIEDDDDEVVVETEP